MTIVTASDRVLLYGAAGMMSAALVLAWLATLTRLMPVARIRGMVRDYPAVVRAHLDLLLMALFCLAFSHLPGKPPMAACVLLVIGGFTNPSLFLLRGLFPDLGRSVALQIYRIASFGVSTIGFVWIVETIVAGNA